MRFGVLNAGNYGIPQMRKRAFIWAARMDQKLPEWPVPTHAFKSQQLSINLPNEIKYSASDDLCSAGLRTMTVKDAISDLPVIQNGCEMS